MEKEILYYPVTLIWKLSVEAKDVEWINRFFNTSKIKERNYNIILWVEGKKSENVHGIIPIGRLVEMSIGVGNTYKTHKDIRDVFGFQLTDANYNEERDKIVEWFFKHKRN